MIKHFFTKQFLRFLFFGGTAFFLNWLSRIILSTWMPFSGAVIVAYFIGMGVAFVLYNFFVFSQSRKLKRKKFRDFVSVNLALLPIVWFFSIVLEKGFRSVGVVYAQALAHGAAIIIPVLVTFLIYKFFAFRDVEYE